MEVINSRTASAGQMPAGSGESFATPHADALPEKPLFIGEARRSRLALDLGELWAARELLYFLTWRDVKVRYKQTLLGATWVVVQPLLTMFLFTFFFGKLVGAPDGMPYPLFAYTGIMPWTFFTNAVINSSNSVVNNSNLITKVYFPRVIVPTAAVAAGFIDLAITSVILFGMALHYGIAPTRGLWLLPIFVALIALLALALGLCVSALGAKYRDIRHALPFVLYLWMFSSPIIYPLSAVTEKWRWAMAFNPMTGIITGFRSALVGKPVDWSNFLIPVVIIAALLVVSLYIFRRVESSFADLI